MWKHEVGVGIEFEFLSKICKTKKKKLKNKKLNRTLINRSYVTWLAMKTWSVTKPILAVSSHTKKGNRTIPRIFSLLVLSGFHRWLQSEFNSLRIFAYSRLFPILMHLISCKQIHTLLHHLILQNLLKSSRSTCKTLCATVLIVGSWK